MNDFFSREIRGFLPAFHDDLAVLRAAIEEMHVSPADPVAHTRLDIAFHEAVAVAAHNDMLREVIRPISEILRMARDFTTKHSTIMTSIHGHEAILNAIEAGNSIAARNAAHAHVTQFEQDIHIALLREREGREERSYVTAHT